MDGSPGNYYLNGFSNTTPVSITLVQGTADFTTSLAAAQIVLTGTSGPGSQSILVQVVGVNAQFINWNCIYDYFTTQSTIN